MRRFETLWLLVKHPLFVGIIITVVGILALSVPLVRDALDIPRMKLEYADLIAIFAIFATIALALLSVMPTVRSIAETSRSVHYSELDALYNHLLEMAITFPFLREPEYIASLDSGNDKRKQYNTYAFMVWNFLETIHDRCDEDSGLKGTWAPVIAAEFAIHQDWFLKETSTYNRDEAKFCLAFCDFVWRSFTKPNGKERGKPHPNWHDKKEWRYRREDVIVADLKASELWHGLHPDDTSRDQEKATSGKHQPALGPGVTA